MNGFKIVWYFIKAHFMTDLQKDFEILALRSQLSVFEQHIVNHKIKKPHVNNCFRMLWVLLSRFFFNWKSVLILFKPETVIGWHKRAFKFYWKLKSKGGRPKISRTTIPLNQNHLESLLKEYVYYYNNVRTHQTLDGKTPVFKLTSPPKTKVKDTTLSAKPILGGLYHEYEKTA